MSEPKNLDLSQLAPVSGEDIWQSPAWRATLAWLLALVLGATPVCAEDNTPAAVTSSGSKASKNRPSVIMDIVVNKAKALAARAYEPPEDTVPQSLAKLTYDQYRNIRFNPAKALWRGLSPFEIQLFHPGFIYKEPIELQMVDQKGITRRVPFNSDLFSYGDDNSPQLAKTAQPSYGYSGFRVHFPLNTTVYNDEVAVFQGASYFRLVGPGQVYGLSARGLAVDTAEVSGEEFPRFTHFWLIQPGPDDNHMVVLALLDSPSITGAFRIDLAATATTTARVNAVLFPRKDIKKVGIAALTSMFFFGEANLRHHDDFRQEVHDSDGLLMHTANDRWIWRPLSNPKTLQVTSLLDSNPRGFGLVQRDRDFEHYLDVEAHYQDRPSLWVQPLEDWGGGRVELVEIPSDRETNDNIVAYWVPDKPFRAGQERRFSYLLRTFNGALPQQQLASVNRTLIGWAAVPGQDKPPPRSERRFAIDFSGGALANLPADLPVEAHLDTSSGKLSEISVKRLPANSGWRVAFRLQPEGNKPADIQSHLHLHGEPLSEEWSYVWTPNTIAE